MRLDNAEIAIATFGHRITEALHLAERLASIADVIIVHQSPDAIDSDVARNLAALDPDKSNIRYVASKELGVAKSRNLALRMARKKYLWFLDDDVEVDLRKCEKFFLGEIWPDSDVITIAASRSTESPACNPHLRPRKHNLISILSVGTIQIIVKPDKVRELNCWFPEDMGAGTNLPISDEPVFLSCCIRNGLRVDFQSVCLVSHHHESSGSRFLEPSHCRARGLAFSRIFGPRSGYAILALFYLKHAPTGLGRYGFRRYVAGFRHSIQGMRLAWNHAPSREPHR